MSFAVASQDHTSVPYEFQLVPGGIFKRNSFLAHLIAKVSASWRLLKFCNG